MDNPLSQLYINRDVFDEPDDDPPYTKLSMHRRSEVRPYNHIGGLRPYDSNEQNRTTARDFNKHITEVNSTEESKRDFYLDIAHKNKKEIDYLNAQNKVDHIKKIDLALNFKMKPSTFTDSYNFTDEKKHDTDNPDTLHHYKKSFMKTYEESKLKHLIILRK